MPRFRVKVQRVLTWTIDVEAPDATNAYAQSLQKAKSNPHDYNSEKWSWDYISPMPEVKEP